MAFVIHIINDVMKVLWRPIYLEKIPGTESENVLVSLQEIQKNTNKYCKILTKHQWTRKIFHSRGKRWFAANPSAGCMLLNPKRKNARYLTLSVPAYFGQKLSQSCANCQEYTHVHQKISIVLWAFFAWVIFFWLSPCPAWGIEESLTSTCSASWGSASRGDGEIMLAEQCSTQSIWIFRL